VLVFPSNTIAADFAGYTGVQATLKLVNQHSWYNSGMLIDIDVPNVGGKINSPPSTWPDDISGGGPFLTVSIGEGQTKSFNLGSSVAQHFINNDYNFLALGNFVAAQAPYNLSYYGYFTGGHNTSLELTITGTKTVAGSNTSGAGSDGKVSFSFASSQTMVFGLSPVSGTDPGGNAFAAGYTGPVSAIQPGSAPAVIETWHNMTLLNGWTLGAGGYAQYRMMPDKMVAIRGQNLVPGTLTDNTPLWTIVTGYVPTGKADQPIVAITRASAAIGTVPRLDVMSSGTLNLRDFAPTTGSLFFSGEYTLD
jgi:hypothetical protein